MQNPEPALVRSWRLLQLFNSYRLIQMLLLLAMTLFSGNIMTNLRWDVRPAIWCIGVAHITLIALGLLFSLRWKQKFRLQVSIQVMLDILAISALMFLVGGMRSGFGGILLISMAGACMVREIRLALFYPAMASIFIISAELLEGWASHYIDLSNFSLLASIRFAQTGFLNLCFFGVAISLHFFGKRLNTNEDLAWKRGVALDNQVLISQRVMERVQDGVLVVDAVGNVVRSNPMARAALKIKEEAHAQNPHLEHLDARLARHYQEWQKNEGESQVMLRRTDNQNIMARFAKTFSSDGASLIFLEDMSRLQEQALQMKLVALGRLTASIAHEIRNPLAAIRHASDLLEEESGNSDNPVQARLLSIVKNNILRLDQLIQDVLVLGKQSSAQQEWISLKHWLDGFVQEISAQQNLDKNLIQVEADEALSLYFEPGHLHQALWNLLGNALRYASRNAGAIRLEARLSGERVELHVIDDGPGVPEELNEHIFEPFFTTATKGTGLGLYIVRELSEANGAHLSVTHGSGGHFVLTGKGKLCHDQEMNGGQKTP